MPGAKFFPDAQTQLRRKSAAPRRRRPTAIVFRGEDKVSTRLTWDELHALVSRLQQALTAAGVGTGDRVAAMLPNLPETIAMMLATASLGAVWSSCSPDFGERGVLDRFGQIEPKIFVAVDGYWYNGKRVSIADKLRAIAGALADGGKNRHRALSRRGGRGGDKPAARRDARRILEAPYGEAGRLRAAAVPSSALYPLFVRHHRRAEMHRARRRRHAAPASEGAPPAQRSARRRPRLLFHHLRLDDVELAGLRAGQRRDADAVRRLAVRADAERAVRLRAATRRFTLFGTSAKYIDACRKAGLAPLKTHDLSALQIIASTGSPLAAESFDYVYRDIKADVHLASISGGTDIVSCFVLGDPTAPVWRGEIQAAGLGMAVDVWSTTTASRCGGRRANSSAPSPFPSMPIDVLERSRRQEISRRLFRAFPQCLVPRRFRRMDGAWRHDHPRPLRRDAQSRRRAHRHGGDLRPGRADPGGHRSDLHRPGLGRTTCASCCSCGCRTASRSTTALDASASRRRSAQGASPRHVPAKIVAVADIPRTKSGKITELAVRDVVHGRPVKNTEALANPEALKLYEGIEELGR